MYLSFMFFTALLIPIPVMAGLMKKKMSPYRVVVEGAIGGISGALFIMILASAAGHSIFSQFQENIRYMAESLAGDPNVANFLGAELSENQRAELLQQIYEQAAELLPSTIAIFAAAGAYTEYLILSRLIKINGEPALRMDRFREFNLPRNIVIAWAGLYLLSWLLTNFEALPGQMLAANINALFDFAFSLQGMSVIFMLCYKRGVPKIIVVIIIIFLLFFGIGKLLLMILGLADVIFRMKQRMR